MKIQDNNQPNRSTLSEHYERIRAFTIELCEPLQVEDFIPQSMTQASPVRWHIAHTTWFFEQFILKSYRNDYYPAHPNYDFLFNSYYNAIGERTIRYNRGLMTRPTLSDVIEYRDIINSRIHNLIHEIDTEKFSDIYKLVMVGLNHEQQHQELLLTDIKHLFSLNPLFPIYKSLTNGHDNLSLAEIKFNKFAEGVYEVGHIGNKFSYDNEHPRHKIYLQEFELANRLVINSEYLDFMADGGYTKPEYWLDDGWAMLNKESWNSPLYWHKTSDEWQSFTLNGIKTLNLNEPVSHVSFYEADAYARWANYRLPTEEEWEIACRDLPIQGNFVDSGRFHPQVLTIDSDNKKNINQAFGDLWEWSASSYRPYPGFKAVAGAIGEYNGKFMSNQFVLRGGSCASSQSHLRANYRNFFYPQARWQFSGIRLARDS